jgi:hypothetical protein
MKIEVPPKAHIQMLQEYVHRLEHALVFFRKPLAYAQADNDEFYATAIEAEDSLVRRMNKGRSQ